MQMGLGIGRQERGWGQRPSPWASVGSHRMRGEEGKQEGQGGPHKTNISGQIDQDGPGKKAEKDRPEMQGESTGSMTGRPGQFSDGDG